ncbi:hypothetical protein [Thermoflavifilum aggregans]|nr:hypothetical protein [Thermoflavifilum aggregans]
MRNLRDQSPPDHMQALTKILAIVLLLILIGLIIYSLHASHQY